MRRFSRFGLVTCLFASLGVIVVIACNSVAWGQAGVSDENENAQQQQKQQKQQQEQQQPGERTVTEKVTTVRQTETRVIEENADAAEAAADEKGVRTVAIFVKNRAKEVPDDKVMVLEDLVVSRLTDRGFHIISREDAINAVATFADEGANKGDENLPGADLDKILSNNTSALRLAQNLGADYILASSITTFGTKTTDFQGQGIKTKITESKMRCSYKLLDATMAGSLTGDVVQATKKDRAQAGINVHENVIDDLLDESATQLAAVLGDKHENKQIRKGPKNKGDVEFGVVAGMADLNIPEIVKNEDGEYIVTANRYRVEGLAVTVAVDGVVVGTTPGPFQAKPGLSKIRLSREMCKDWEQTINIKPNMTLNVSMVMSEDGYRRWRQNAQFLNDLKAETKLTDAQVKAWEGFAKFLEQSGYRVDKRIDEKSDHRSDIRGDDGFPTPPAPPEKNKPANNE